MINLWMKTEVEYSTFHPQAADRACVSYEGC